MVFLIVLIVATAVLIAWLLVPRARVALGDFRSPRLREREVQSAPGAGPPLPAVGGDAAESNVADYDRSQERRPPARRPSGRDDLVLYDATDVEMAVRDRLYGRHGQRD